MELRGQGMKWEDIARQFVGRTNIACRLRYQNYLEKRHKWTDGEKANLAIQYERRKEEMWKDIADELRIPWRACEDMHWKLGQEEMASLAGGTTLHGRRSAINQGASGQRVPAGFSPSSGLSNMQTRFVSTPTSTFPRLPAQPRAMLAQASTPATTNGTAPPRFMPGYEETGHGFHGTSQRPSSSGDQLPSMAEMDRNILAYAAQDRGRYREEDEEEVADEDEMEEEVAMRAR
ncbi:MAG: hypothetical protein Q9224_001179 [Gallowayella concinna]